MPSILASAVKTGDNIKVTLLDNLAHVINGSVIALATYDVAKSMQSDLPARHAAIQAYEVSLGHNPLPEITEEKFFILNTGGIRPTVIAFDWIAEGGLELVERGATYKIKLLNTSKADADAAIAILRANNIACQLDVLY